MPSLIRLPHFVMGLETSCDETAIGIVEAKSKRLCCHVLASQIPLHEPYFGVVPELASRAHLEKIHGVLEEALKKAHLRLAQLDAIAYTQGPGLKGSLLVGYAVAKALAFGLKKPAVGVHHLEAHLATILFENPHIKPPLLGLVVSGGHTDLVYVKQWGHYVVLGRTLDDACGEALDKLAKLLRLGYPGGPIIDRLSKKGNPKAIHFPRPLQKRRFDFSFSGLKTSALYWLRDHGGLGSMPLEDFVASFQEAICEALLAKTREALFSLSLKTVVVSGGVAANSRLRFLFRQKSRQEGWQCYFPSQTLCTDNGAMIALLGSMKLASRKSIQAPPVDSTLPFTRW